MDEKGSEKNVRGIKHINWCGIVFNHAGYAGDNRDFLRTLNKMGVPDITLHTLEDNRTIDLPDEAFFESLLPNKFKWDDGITVVRNSPMAILRQAKGSGKLVGYGQCEFETIPKPWKRKLNYCDEVWVSSHWQKNVYKQNGIEPDCHVIPLGIDTVLWRPKQSSFQLKHKTEDVFSFYSIMHLHPRKGYGFLLKAFFEEFKPKEPVELVIKAFLREDEKHSLEDAQVCENLIDQVKKISLVGKDIPTTYFVTERFSDADMVEFHNAFDCFVLPTRGEGWGKPAYEAMACEKPIIVTNATALTEFVTKDNAYLLKSTGTEPAWGMDNISPEVNGMEWHMPDIEHLKKLMRFAYENREVSKRKGVRARKDISKYTWNSATGLMINRLEDLSNG